MTKNNLIYKMNETELKMIKNINQNNHYYLTLVTIPDILRQINYKIFKYDRLFNNKRYQYYFLGKAYLYGLNFMKSIYKAKFYLKNSAIHESYYLLYRLTDNIKYQLLQKSVCLDKRKKLILFILKK